MQTQTVTNEDLLAHIVRQQALQRPLAQVMLSKVYAVMAGLETDCLRVAHNIKAIASKKALEQALASSNTVALLVKQGCVTLDELTQMLGTVGHPFTIYMETAA